jgi:diguanylate cyclase (GGDEF)-like protein
MLTKWGNNTRVMVLIFLLLSGVFFGVINTFLFSNVKGLITDLLGQSAIQVASTTAKILEEDIEAYEDLVTSAMAGTEYDKEYYDRMLRVFQDIKADTGCTYVYTEIKYSETEIMYILDGEAPDSDLFSPMGSLDELEVQENQAYQEKEAVATNIVEWDIWGKLVSGYAPIIHPDTGELVGLVGVDFSIDHIRGLLQNVLGLMIFFGVALATLSTWVFYKLFKDRFHALNVDYLTGLYSRRFLDYRLDKHIKRAEKRKGSLCLIMIDIDDFKQINDTYGHEIGDQVLQYTANLLKETIGGNGYPCRLGGDEFLALITECSENDGYRMACSMNETHVGGEVHIPKDVPHGLTIGYSIGIACWQEGMNGRQLMEEADHALYEAKESGKNQICTYKG